MATRRKSLALYHQKSILLLILMESIILLHWLCLLVMTRRFDHQFISTYNSPLTSIVTKMCRPSGKDKTKSSHTMLCSYHPFKHILPLTTSCYQYCIFYSITGGGSQLDDCQEPCQKGTIFHHACNVGWLENKGVTDAEQSKLCLDCAHNLYTP